MSEPLLRVRDLHVDFGSSDGTVRAVDGVSFDLAAGETLGIVGESGCGKSTLAHALMRLLPPAARISSGSIEFDGSDLLRLGRRNLDRLRGGQLGIVFQNPMTALNPVLPIGKQIAEALMAHRDIGAAAAKRRCEELLDLVGLPDPKRQLARYPHQLSGGMRQRAVIAASISCDPKLLIADEPTTALDVTVQAQVLDLLQRLSRSMGMAVILISHDLGVIASLADRVNVMYAGRIVEDVPLDDVLTRPQHPYSMGLMRCLPRVHGERPGRLPTIPGHAPTVSEPPTACSFQPRCAHAAEQCATAAPPLAAIAAERRAACWVLPFAGGDEPVPATTGIHGGASEVFAPGEDAGTTELLAVSDLEVVFRSRGSAIRAVDRVSLTIAKGETLGLVGESGSGKSTLGRAALMLERPTAGTVRFRDADLTALGDRRLRTYRRQMQMIFQDPYASLDPRQRVGSALYEVLKIHGIATGAAADGRVAELLDAVGLPAASAGRYPHEFSGGQRQRVAIARALAVDPDFLVCDEATSALDVSVQAQIVNLLKDLQDRYGLTYLFIAHNLAVVRQIATRVAVMYLGRIVELGARDEVFARPRHPYTQALLAAVPEPEPRTGQARALVRGDAGQPSEHVQGCVFQARCPHARDRCATEEPELEWTRDGQATACHFWREITPSVPVGLP